MRVHRAGGGRSALVPADQSQSPDNPHGDATTVDQTDPGPGGTGEPPCACIRHRTLRPRCGPGGSPGVHLQSPPARSEHSPSPSAASPCLGLRRRGRRAARAPPACTDAGGGWGEPLGVKRSDPPRQPTRSNRAQASGSSARPGAAPVDRLRLARGWPPSCVRPRWIQGGPSYRDLRAVWWSSPVGDRWIPLSPANRRFQLQLPSSCRPGAGGLIALRKVSTRKPIEVGPSLQEGPLGPTQGHQKAFEAAGCAPLLHPGGVALSDRVELGNMPLHKGGSSQPI